MVHDYYCTNPRPKLPQSVVPLQLIMPPLSLCEMQTASMCSKYIIWHFTVLLSIFDFFFLFPSRQRKFVLEGQLLGKETRLQVSCYFFVVVPVVAFLSAGLSVHYTGTSL